MRKIEEKKCHCGNKAEWESENSCEKHNHKSISSYCDQCRESMIGRTITFLCPACVEDLDARERRAKIEAVRRWLGEITSVNISLTGGTN